MLQVVEAFRPVVYDLSGLTPIIITHRPQHSVARPVLLVLLLQQRPSDPLRS